MKSVLITITFWLFVFSAYPQYCTPTFPSGTEPICRVILNTIDNSTSCLTSASAYENYTTISTTLIPGNSYSITVYGNTNGNYTNHINVYFDWNDNGVLDDAGEGFYLGTITNCGNCAVTGSITVPAGISGVKRMRVIKKYNTQAVPCNNAGFGQAEDYTVNVTNPVYFHNTAFAPGLQTAFNHIRLDTGEPMFTLSSGYASYNAVEIELNSQSDFTGTAYIQTFSGTYVQSTKYDLLCNNLSPALPAGEATYYIRARVSDNGGSTWSGYSGTLWVFTRGTSEWGWHFTAVPQFSVATPVTTSYGNFITGNNNGTTAVTHDDFLELGQGSSLNAITTSADQALTEGTTYYGGASYDCITVGYYNVTGNQDYHGFRFQNAAIPQGAQILSAYFQPYGHTGSGCGGSANSTNQLNLRITGVAQDNCNTWANTTNTTTGQPRYRDRIASGELWSVPSGASQQWSTGLLITTAPDITSVVQEIVNRPGYAAGNAIGIIVDHNGATGNYWRYFATPRSNASYSARLVTTFTNYYNDIRFPNVALANYAIAESWNQLVFHTDLMGCAACDITFSVYNAANNNLIATGNSSPINLNNSTADSVYVIARMTRTSASPRINDLTLTVTRKLPVADFQASSLSICQGECINYTDLTTNYPHTWQWTFNGASTASSSVQNPTGICYNTPGTYEVVLTATNLGGNDTETKTSYITVHALPNVNLGNDTVLCYGQSITLDAGTGSTYQWSTGASSQTLTVSTPDTYGVTVTGGAGCSASASVTIGTNPQLSLSSAETHASCYGNTDGGIDLSPGGGTSPYTFLWSNSQTTEDISGLAAGTYSVTVTDNNSCTSLLSATITEPTALSTSLTETQITCFGLTNGMIDQLVSGGTTGYTYAWSNSATTQNVSGLGDGTYTVTVTDANSCTTVASATITEPTEIEIINSVINASCNGSSTGSIDVIITGGTGSYSFEWSNTATSEDLLNIPAGNYSITVTDTNGCTMDDSFSVAEPEPLSITVSGDNAVCGASNGKASVTVMGGAGGFTFEWSNGSTNDTINNLAAGTYYITVTDLNNCTANDSVIISSVSTGTLQVTSINHVTCNGGNNGAITVDISGGSAPYTYEWSHDSMLNLPTAGGLAAGTYSVTITDGSLCVSDTTITITEPTLLSVLNNSVIHNLCYGDQSGTITAVASGGTPAYTFLWSNTETTATISNLAAGDYTVTVSDSNGCTTTATTTINEPSQLSPAVDTQTGILCYGDCNGIGSVTVTGGTPPYQYAWPGSTWDQALNNNLCAASHTVTVTDVNGCTATTVINISGPAELIIQNTDITAVTCFGNNDGSVTINATGGTAPAGYTYQLESLSQSSNTFTGLAAGTYGITVTDNNGCTVTTTVQVNEPMDMMIDLFGNTNPCYGASAGSLTATVSGGTPPFIYQWDNGAQTASILNLPVGTYTVTVTDLHNCTGTASAEITQPTEIVVIPTTTNPLCYGTPTGLVSIAATGGTPPYTYLWSNGSTDALNANVGSGTYFVTITDNSGCELYEELTITSPPALGLTMDFGTDPVTHNGFVNMTANGGTPPYSYLWSNGATTANLTNLPGGDYIITITDANGCTFIYDSAHIYIPLIIPNVISPNDDGINDDFEILNIVAYEKVVIEIFNRWGDRLFVFSGTGLEYSDPANRWNGTHNGNNLPMGSYVYVIILDDIGAHYTGAVLIKR